jgi:hypothetical protein
MKKYLSLLIVAICMVSTGFARVKNILPLAVSEDVKKVVLFTDLTPEMTKELLEGQHPNVAVECREGVELPFKYVGNFGLYSINFSPNLSIRMEKTCYFRFVKKSRKAKSSKVKSFISFNLKDWEKASNLKFKEPLEVNLGMSPDKSHFLLNTFSKADTEDNQ